MALAEETVGYRRLFEHTRSRLERRGIEVALEFGSGVSANDFAPLEETWGLPIPWSLRQFYLETGNGLTFRWPVDRSAPSQPFCRLCVPNLAGLSKGIDYLRMQNESLASHDFWEPEEREAARHHYRRQLTYFPFLQENADLLCIEPADGAEVVVFHDHEWSLHTAGDSGIQLAGTLRQFWWGWSEVGFVEPKENWWPQTAGIGRTVWSQENFGFSIEAA
jgi:hypothetical protein